MNPRVVTFRLASPLDEFIIDPDTVSPEKSEVDCDQ
jgi:hypothetical protein